jgi:hypothetical protein
MAEDAAAANATGNLTREIAKELSFENISVHSPGPFCKSSAMRDNPSGGTFRAALRELNATRDSFTRILDGARDMVGSSEHDLARIKNSIKRLKFGTHELGTEQAFLLAILESRPLPRAPPQESHAFQARNARFKALKEGNDADEQRVHAGNENPET